MTINIFFLSCCLTLFSCLYAAQVSAADLNTIKLASARFVLDSSEQPPEPDADWQAVSLIDRWSPARYRQADTGWYQIPVTLPPSTEKRLAIYLPRFNMNAAVYLNRQFLADGGSFEDPVSRNWNRPLFIETPEGLWHEGDNTIHIRLRSYPGHGYLAPVFVGTVASLKPEYELRRLLQIDISRILLPITLFIGIFILALWLYRRKDSQYLWFSLSVLMWSHFSANMIVVDIPVSAFVWEVMAYASVDWFAVFLALFGLRFAGHPFSLRDGVFLVFALLATLAYASTDLNTIKSVARIWHGGSILIGTYVVVTMFRDGYRTGNRDYALIATGMAVILATAVHDWMFQFGYISLTGRTGFHLLHYSAPIIFALMAWHLVRRFIRALNEAEILNLELEQRIEKKSRALEKHYQTIEQMKNRELILHERERFSREIHDGMSGNIANAIMMSDLIQRDLQGQKNDPSQQRLQRLKDQLLASLMEMRNLILTMEGDVSTMGTLLNHINDKCGQLLADAGIGFELVVDTLDEDYELSQKQSLNILRILQEATNNIIKHSRANSVNMHINDDGRTIQFQVDDDGCGYDPDDRQSGYGMNNMQKRATEIDARLNIVSKPQQGTNLTLNLNKAEEST